MKSTLNELKDRVQAALVAAFGDEYQETDPILVGTNNPKFGDYQANVAMSLAKPLRMNPRAIATKITANLDVTNICEPPSIAGPGFINFKLKTEYLEQQLKEMHSSDRLGVPKANPPQKVIVDYPSPNIAKEMHVGHLRPAVIGECFARVLEFLGHDVLKVSHVGDWGTPFGMLIAYLQEAYPDPQAAAAASTTGELATFYRQAKKRFDTDEAFKENARQAVVKLQAGDQAVLEAWQRVCQLSKRSYRKIYDLLNISEDIIDRGESFYNPYLADVVTDLDKAGLLVEDDGAKCVFLEGFTNKDGEPLPLIVQKSNGGYNYATTDLAALRYRITEDKVDRIVYSTDAGQANHFSQFFQVARRAGWVPESVELSYAPFGLVQGEDGKRLKSRSGEVVPLQELLDEAIARTRTDVEGRLQQEERTESDDFIQNVAEKVGIGAVKYADLSQNRISNYTFSYDRMLALQGNTAPYMMYAYVRVQGISRKGEIDLSTLDAQVKLTEESELTLAKHLLQLDEVLAEVEKELLPNRLCQYLFELSQKFNQFYDQCSVLQAEEPQRTSRLVLCDLTARTLKLGLSLLGIDVLERM
ncbi:arginyl-tRNA synthetase [Synechococcus sp. PCC 7335]|uniref:arginine--tRNA ligase n=1 Tax=Synechococcus sp. (strain ATCC 29403 / PCC 7335) TaxID=91464 RepID=UPI00017EB845|nr:arginine--tRNA ligase [Synechococcus sp. PCC 7335]EDX85041.1 arginyl-tRNA synthetase [Synechococcus sp. PCC 7335]